MEAAVKDATDFVLAGGHLSLAVPEGDKHFSVVEAAKEAFAARTIYPSGLDFLDSHLGGYEAGELVVYAAEQGVGKSTLCLYSGLRAAAKGTPVTYLSLEDSVRRVGARALCMLAGIDDRKLRLRAAGLYSFSPEEQAKLDRARKQLANYPLSVVHPRHCTAASVLRAVAEAAQKGSRIIFVDYVQRISFSGAGDSPWQAINEFLFEYESMAQRSGFVPIIVSQLHPSGASNGEMPSAASKLKGSKVIADVSRLLLVLSRHEGTLCVRCEKSTDGVPPKVQRFVRQGGVFQPYKGV